MQKIIIIIPIFIVVGIVLYPVIKNTLFWAGDGYGLILLSQQKDEDISYNPFNKDVSLINPSMAVWILRNMDYPYNTCSFSGKIVFDCRKPLLMVAGDELGVKNNEKDLLLLEFIEIIVSKGLPLNQQYQGMTSVHYSILHNQPDYLSILLLSGADPDLTIDKEGKDYNGLNAFELYSFLERAKPNSRKLIGETLAKYKPNNTN